MKLNPAQERPTALTLRSCALGVPAGAPPRRLPAELAVLFGEHPFPQPCREVYPRRLPI
jgi:hypothetical protein